MIEMIDTIYITYINPENLYKSEKVSIKEKLKKMSKTLKNRCFSHLSMIKKQKKVHFDHFYFMGKMRFSTKKGVFNGK